MKSTLGTLFSIAVALSAAPLPGLAQNSTESTARLHSTFYNWETLDMKPNKTGARCDVIDAPTLTFSRLSVHVTTLNPGMAVHPPQGHPQEEVVLVKEGNLEVSLNGEKRRAGPGSMLFLAAHAVHNLTNIGDKPAVYYVFDVFTEGFSSIPDRPEGDWIPAGKLRSTLYDPDSLPVKPTKNGSSCPIVTSPTYTFAQFSSHLTTLNPGKTTGVLTDPGDEIIIVKSGLAQSTINGVSCRLGPGSFYFQASNDPHSMTNVGAVPTTYQVLKWVTDKTPKDITPTGFTTLDLGDPAPDFSLLGVDGKRYSLADFKDAPVLMVIFLSNHCPVSHAAETRLIPFVKAMQGTGLAVVAINPNNEEGLQIDELGYSKYGENYEGMKAYARDRGFNFPFLYDGGTQATAKAYGCLCTPDVFIFDRDRHLRYMGRFDDSDLIDPASVHSTDAINAARALVAGQTVPVAITRPIGCATKWKILHNVVAAFDAKWEKLPVSIEPIDAAGVAALVSNPTRKLRVINLWATWCGPCVEEFPSLISLERRMMRRDYEFITISMDGPDGQAKAERFLEKQHAATPDKDRISMEKEGRRTNNYIYTGGGNDALAKALDPQWPGPIPYTIVVAPGGRIVSRWSGEADITQLQNNVIDTLGLFRTVSQLGDELK